MGAKIQAFDIFQTPLSSHYPLPLITFFNIKIFWSREFEWKTIFKSNDRCTYLYYVLQKETKMTSKVLKKTMLVNSDICARTIYIYPVL